MTAVPVLLNTGARTVVGDAFSGDLPADFFMTLSGLAAGAARVSEQFDLNIGPPGPMIHRVWVRLQWAATPAADAVAEVYWCDWDNNASWPGGQLPTSDTGYASGSAGVSKAKSLPMIGVIQAETAAVGPFSRWFDVTTWSRYGSLMIVNRAAVALATNNDIHRIIIEPKWIEGQ